MVEYLESNNFHSLDQMTNISLQIYKQQFCLWVKSDVLIVATPLTWQYIDIRFHCPPLFDKPSGITHLQKTSLCVNNTTLTLLLANDKLHWVNNS